MNNKIAWTAIALWLGTITAAGILFVRGNTAPSPDGRTAVLMSSSERDFVMVEMRSLLAAIRNIAEGIAHDDRIEVAKAARSVGMAASHDAAPVLLAKLPLGFKQMAMPLHDGFDDLAAAADRGDAFPALTGRMIAQLDRCTACHDSFRIDVAP